MSGPAVSICVPTYNGAAFIGETIDSALAQTHRDFELIVVDDASTDDTAAVVSTRTDSRIRYVRHEQNRGAAATWNHAISMSRAPLVKLLCHDDTLTPDCLAKQLPAMNDPDVVLVSCWRRVTRPDGRTIMVRRGLRAGTFDRARVVRAVVRSGTNIVGEPSAGLFRRDAWQAAGGYDSENLYMIDVDFWLKLLRHGRLFIVPDTLCSFRVSATSLSTILARRQVAAGRRFFDELRADAANRLTRADVVLGTTRAIARSWGRQLIYSTMRRS